MNKTIFVDFDDTFVNSIETVIGILNNRYGLNKTASDLKDWKFNSIVGCLTRSDVNELFECDEFWNNIKVFDGAIECLKDYNVFICSCGTKKNIENKIKFIKSLGLEYGFKMIDTASGKNGKDKKDFDMSGCIQIDDRFDNLSGTNASVKILYKNFNNYPWQEIGSNSNIYIANNWKDVDDILRWC